MNFQTLLTSWQGLRTAVYILSAFCASLIAANLALTLGLVFHDETVVLVPPILDSKVSVSRRQADEGLLKSWGLYFAQLLGNATPGNTEFLKESMAPVLSPKVFSEFMTALNTQAEEMRFDRVSLRFEPRLVQYEKSTGLVFVTGQSVAVGPGGDEKRKERTYEFLIEIRNFMPLLSRMDTYQGSARTSRVREKLRARDNRNGAGRNKDNRRRDDHNEY
ncbi:TraE/TraK family type IV conjugative transfer system protein [Succinimonas amylolytica]|uniref:TraE/TraK family type IV conjugative transfer system protein n=1 Tax=Succinimonas amylolytica TaxID=83769 RepID=UPI00036EFAD3|nr:TraE/TraK family type IV conjugative transfer system protein [Succinimonas amylolytica]